MCVVVVFVSLLLFCGCRSGESKGGDMEIGKTTTAAEIDAFKNVRIEWG